MGQRAYTRCAEAYDPLGANRPTLVLVPIGKLYENSRISYLTGKKKGFLLVSETLMGGTMFSRLCVASLMITVAACAADTSTSSTPVTFDKDVLGILQQNCQGCHRPGQIAPMSLLTYENVRPWAKAIKAAVVSRKMPPWNADPLYGHFANDRSLKPSDIDTIVKWADAGAPEGEAKDAPPQVKFPADGWQIQPDIIVKGPETVVPARPKNNVIEWQFVVMPTGFTKDTWVTSMEVKPSDLSVTHHICVEFMPHRPDVKYGVPEWVDQPRDDNGSVLPRGKGQRQQLLRPETQIRNSSGIEICYLPGIQAGDYRPFQAAKLVPAGSDLVFHLHYTPNGKEVTSRPLVGFTVAKEKTQRKYISLSVGAASDSEHFAIPPNDANWASQPGEATFLEDAEIVWLSPHMHLRGKDFTFRVEYPDGRMETLLQVPRYDFNWQLGYELAQPAKIPKGTKIIVTAHYDNSVNNKFNPDPNRTVYNGTMTWEEMMVGFFAVTVDKNVDPKKILKQSAKFTNGG